MKKNRRALLIILFFVSGHSFASDTAHILSKSDFLNLLLRFHPVVRQASFAVQRATAEVTEARGAFDPVLKMGVDRKTFDGLNYYRYFNPELAIPTWYGLELKAGLEDIGGERVTAEETLGRTSYAGVSLSLNEIIFDKRRATLQQAKAFRSFSEAQQRMVINDIVFDGISQYLEWLKEHRAFEVFANAVENNRKRFAFVKTEFEQGSRPAIDTVEALAQLNNILLQQNERKLARQNAGLGLSLYLWLEDGRPLSWTEKIIPDSNYQNETLDSLPPLEQLTGQAAKEHPALVAASNKIDIQRTERLLKAQSLIPKLRVSANMLNKGYALPDKFSAEQLRNNHKLGIQFSVPIFQREARGAYQSSKFKLQEIIIDRNAKALEIENKIRSYYNEAMINEQQVEIYNQLVLQTRKLLQGEMLRYETGESTLFLINSRENKLLETEQKLVEAVVKWQKSLAGLQWSAGNFTMQKKPS